MDHHPTLYSKTSSLRTLFFSGFRRNRTKKAVNNLLRDSKFLRVIYAEDGFISDSTAIKICNIRQLTYLHLSSGAVFSLPHAIRNLESLLTLDLREAWGVYLPNVIWSMKKLRHILLPKSCFADTIHLCHRHNVKLDVFRPVEISLPNLQTFSVLPCNLFKADWLHKLTSLRTLRVRSLNKDIIGVLSNAVPVSHKLQRLTLDPVYDNKYKLDTSSFNLSRYDNLSELIIWRARLNELSHDKLPPNLTTLDLMKTKLTKDPMAALKKLRKLKFLKLDDLSYLGKKLVCSGEPDNFPQLEVLWIGCLPKLKRVVVKEGGMPRLRDFRILRCSPEMRIPDRVRNVMKTVE